MTGGLLGGLRALVLLLCLGLAGGAAAQTASPAGSGPPVEQPKAPVELDYQAWGKLAERVEAATDDAAATNPALEDLRAQVADWRSRFQAAQGANSSRIATLREQIGALGPAPEEGKSEAPEIAARRTELNDQLTRLQAPVIAAEEAYSRADGLIREVDQVLRERQTEEFLHLWPMPVNPANWPAAVEVLGTTLETLSAEVRRNWANPGVRTALTAALPLILGLLVIAGVVIWRGRRWVEWLSARLTLRMKGRLRRVLTLLVSLGLIVIPTLGVYALSHALLATGLAGLKGTVLLRMLPVAGFIVIFARWLALLVFPRNRDDNGDALNISAPDRRMGRFYVGALGVLIALETLRQSLMDPARVPEAATSVLTFPIFALMALALFQLGRLLRRHAATATPSGEAAGFRARVIAFIGLAAQVIAVLGVGLAAVGYVAAGAGMVIPAVVSLALMAVIQIAQTLIDDLYGLAIGSADGKRDALFPVLVGFFLAIVSVPLFAMIWGARASEIAEVFTRIGEGFLIGETRISPTSFIVFVIVFGLGYLATRVFQGALRAMILPKTRLDLGGQNAVAAGIGYIGVFAAALIAINSAGIDLSGLAIVAGALSLGIGIGLQNIVQNFVSGIILLVERPVSEGDWVDVGGTQGIVQSISVRSTRIQTFDRNDVIVPNADLVSGRVTNWTRFNLTGRLIVPVGVAYGSDTRKVERVLREIAEAQPLAILNPPPLILFMGFGTDALNFEIRVILRDVNYSLTVRNEINHQIAERFVANGIDMPFAQRDLWLRNADELAAAFRGGPATAVPDLPPADPPSLAPRTT